jgi:hypothetical protein
MYCMVYCFFEKKIRQSNKFLRFKPLPKLKELISDFKTKTIISYATVLQRLGCIKVKIL